MTLPASGTITFANVNVELGVSSTTTRSLNDSAVRSLAEVPSGAISMSNLHGKSLIVFSRNSGSYSSIVTGDTASLTTTCSVSATWTWSRTGSITGSTASIASGGTGTTFTVTQTPPVSGTRQTTYTVTATAGSVTRNYTFVVEATN